MVSGLDGILMLLSFQRSDEACLRPKMDVVSHISDQLKVPVQPAAYKLADACQYLGGLSQITVRRLVHRGLLRPNRAVRHLVFSQRELDRFLAEGM